jgi:hypothetical protein
MSLTSHLGTPGAGQRLLARLTTGSSPMFVNLLTSSAVSVRIEIRRPGHLAPHVLERVEHAGVGVDLQPAAPGS